MLNKKVTMQVFTRLIRSIHSTNISLANQFIFTIVNPNFNELYEGTMKERDEGE